MNMLNIESLYINNLQEVNCVESLPNLTWKVKATHRDESQIAFQYQVSTENDFSKIILDSGRQESDRSVNVKINLENFDFSQRYFVRVKCWNNYNQESDWKQSSFISGLNKNNWQAKYIRSSLEETNYEQQGIYFRKNFAVDNLNEVESVMIHATAGGIYQAYLNNEEIIDGVLKPGFTSYKKNHLYQTAEITNKISNDNTIVFHVGPGWYCGRLGWLDDSALYDVVPGMICQIIVRYKNGTKEVIPTDDSWKWSESPVVFSSIYDGETYDSRKEIGLWSEASEDNASWVSCISVNFDLNVLKPQDACVVERIETISAKSIFESPCGETIVDFGQNMSGLIEFEVAGQAGDVLTIEHFEVLDKEGNAHIENLRTAGQKNTFIIGPKKRYSYSPHFTFQGFRYARISKSSPEIAISNIEAIVIHSALERTGHFESSNSLLNKLHENIRWGMKGNFVDIPTDCPQRDERLGWTGDAQIFSKTACYLYDSKSFFTKWLVDVSCDQLSDGGIPFVVPDTLTGRVDSHPFFKKSTHSSAGWGDAIVIIPWQLYLMYGDKEVLENHYQSMCKYLEFVESKSHDYVYDYEIQFGDWLALDAEKGSFFGGTPTAFTGTAYFAYSTKLLGKISEILGYSANSDYYNSLSERIRQKFVSEFVGNDCERLPQTQTSHILPLHFNLVSNVQKKKIASGLVTLIQNNNGHLNTGFLGTPHICEALSDNGYKDAAYELLLQETYPSWLNQVKLGATTIWEHWDGIQNDGSLRDPGMNSFNHYAYGAVGQWLYSNVLGIRSIESNPGFKKFRVSPLLSSRLSYASGQYSTCYGEIKVSWVCLSESDYELEVEVPFNSQAIVSIPECCISRVDGFSINNRNELIIGSGKYKLHVTSLVKEMTFN
ncbi:glycoside hydrolase family 78 protein [Photobacterium sp. ZSDE20]|uniref:alpha-L-rhamnosidase n=1 Tax=Photobacterium pectinilyticum TaxID=2906793 RepID=A0ABT1N577_9GAMM|nr:alpha-L-rhamnosidase [Photobacterium sp. ZSDE20]MCQ1059888.1 glycoside hydrolase family 78 protein [Photobacterium sp. ZSDE20]MDD1826077.1 glycoside hydrolase family 78 protein [Photobacterium sp. ZSDE20]